MSSNEQTIGAERQTPPSGAATDELLDAEPEDQIARLRQSRCRWTSGRLGSDNHVASPELLCACWRASAHTSSR